MFPKPPPYFVLYQQNRSQLDDQVKQLKSQLDKTFDEETERKLTEELKEVEKKMELFHPPEAPNKIFAKFGVPQTVGLTFPSLYLLPCSILFSPCYRCRSC